MIFDTKRGKALKAIADRLRAMTVATGYHWDVRPGSVYTDPVNLLAISGTEAPLFLVELSENSREFLPANELEDEFDVLITGLVEAPGTAPDRKVIAGENLIGDVERTLCVDVTLGGQLFDLRVVHADPPLAGMGTQSKVVVLVTVRCSQHRQHGAP
ncbi:MAG TPA: hypothetical protein VM364_00550 [Vicinamibacterales bacterium]|nr:hypothetical protein [Vicinamibacterales bacterium]